VTSHLGWRPPITKPRKPRASVTRPGCTSGPFGEDAAVALTLAEMRNSRGDAYAIAGKRRYPSGRYVCDLALGHLPDWAIEVKMARLGRDNGTYEEGYSGSVRPVTEYI
jgi:hypothetical protein